MTTPPNWASLLANHPAWTQYTDELQRHLDAAVNRVLTAPPATSEAELHRLIGKAQGIREAADVHTLALRVKTKPGAPDE